MNLLLLSQPSSAPGQGPATAPAQPSQGAPSGPEGGAPSGSGSPFGGMSTILIMLLPLLFVLFMSRSQSKKQKELESALKPGDRVITQSGLIGKLVDVGDRTVKLEIASGVYVQMLKASIQGLDSGDAKPAEAKDKAQEKKA